MLRQREGGGAQRKGQPNATSERNHAPQAKSNRTASSTSTAAQKKTDIKQRIEELIKEPHRIIEAKEPRKELLQIIEKLVNRLKSNRIACETHAERRTPTELQKINLKLDKLIDQSKKIIKPSQITTATRSYADAVKAASYVQPQRTPIAPPPLRRARELIVRFSSKTDIQKNRERNNTALLNAISPEARQSIISLRRLPSGDIALRTSNEAAKQKLANTTAWAKELGESTSIVRNTYAVLVHGVPLSTDIKNQEQARRKIYSENAELHPDLEILRLAWPKSAKGKAYSSLIIEIANATQANRILEEGIRFGQAECDTELFEKGCIIIMCYNCYGFGHISKVCRSQTTCHKCDGKHAHTECRRTMGDYCANCKTVGHKPWMAKCPEWQKEKAKKDQVYQNRPRRFPATSPLSPSTQKAPTCPTSSPTLRTNTPAESPGHAGEEPASTTPNTPSSTLLNATPLPQHQILAGVKRKASDAKENVTQKRRPGRPRGILTAGAEHTQSRLVTISTPDPKETTVRQTENK